MRLYPIASCLLVAIWGIAFLSGSEGAGAKAPPDISALMAQLAKLPESRMRTGCVFADPYRQHRQRDSAHAGYSSAPEYRHYLECLLAEARRSGGRLRLASASSFPKVGTCYSTRIAWIGGRLNDDRLTRDSGTTVVYDNGLGQTDYSYVPEVGRSRIGDKARVCVHDLPVDCPGDDLRGISYRTRNLRTGGSWIMSDSQHSCRGA